MKITLHIPTEQYGYCQAEFEADDMNAVAHNYREIAKVFKSSGGLPDKEYNAFIDRMLAGEDNHVETYQAMSDQQKDAVQVIKRAQKRLDYKSKEPKIYE